MSAIETEAVHGLSETAAAARLQSDGPNVLPAPLTAHPSSSSCASSAGPLVYVLLAAAVLSLGLKHLTDAGFIGFVLVVNALDRSVAGTAGGTADCEPAGPAAHAGNGPARRRRTRN